MTELEQSECSAICGPVVSLVNQDRKQNCDYTNRYQVLCDFRILNVAGDVQNDPNQQVPIPLLV
jgi:hypothetical protein